MTEINPDHFRVAIFGSARIKKGDDRYKQIFSLAKMIAETGYDVVTGGGPSLMDAASRGHHAGRHEKDSHSIGLAIHLPKEQKDGFHLDIKKEYNRFSDRLDGFMELSDVVVVGPGGIGTLLELFYTWQLVQVKHICETPIILLGKHWNGLIDWIKNEVLGQKLINAEDMDFVFIVDTPEDTMNLIKQFHKDIEEHGSCKNFKKYRK